MTDVFLDTTVFIDFHRGDASAVSLIRELQAGNVSVWYSALTAFELWVVRLDQREELEYLALMQFMTEAPLTAEIARAAAALLRNSAPAAPENLIRDAMIAATAANRDATIYTRNVRDFRRLYANVESY